jgi:hypothetical protein
LESFLLGFLILGFVNVGNKSLLSFDEQCNNHYMRTAASLRIMTKGKQWTAQQEAQLKSLIEANTSLTEIAAALQKTSGAVIIKSQRLGLKLQNKGYINKSVPIPRELPSVEEALKMLGGALKTAVKPGLDKIEVQRLQAVAAIAKTYQEMLADYINYREIETKLKEMEEQNAQLLKERSPNNAPQPNPAPLA